MYKSYNFNASAQTSELNSADFIEINLHRSILPEYSKIVLEVALNSFNFFHFTNRK